MDGIDFVKQVIQRSGGTVPTLPEFDKALVGFQNSAKSPLRPVYDFDRCIDILMEGGLTESAAIEQVVQKLESLTDICMVTLIRDAFDDVDEDVEIGDSWRTFSGEDTETEEFTFTFTDEDPETDKLK